MRIEDQIEEYRKELAAAETKIAFYVEQLDEEKAKLKKAGIASDNLPEKMSQLRREIKRLKRREDRAFRETGKILTEIEEDLVKQADIPF